ncbi:MAG TPA: efflux RND transporter periplasmic adaptor subunit [Steroidobacteraceae bacterium]
MRRRLIIVVLAAGVLLALLVGFNLVKQHFMAQARLQNASPPQTVSAMKVQYSDWQPHIDAIGTLRATLGVDVTTEVAGLVRTLHFKSGDVAKAGEVLVELNADSDLAQLHALEAAADLSSTVYERDKLQFQDQAISKAQLDADAADLKNKRAMVAAQAALVAKKILRAPFAGQLGITTVNPGQYLNTGDKVVTLQSVDPIYVDFKLPQQELARITTGQSLMLTTDSYPGVSFPGKINAIDPKVDSSTRNFQAEATVANADHRLLPGMFGRVSVTYGGTERYLTLPQTAITYNPYGTTIFVAQHTEPPANQPPPKKGQPPAATLKAQQVFVTLGATRGDQVAVIKGLNEGDLVVTSGQLKLNNGTPLVIDNSVAPRDDANPAPQEH